MCTYIIYEVILEMLRLTVVHVVHCGMCCHRVLWEFYFFFKTLFIFKENVLFCSHKWAIYLSSVLWPFFKNGTGKLDFNYLMIGKVESLQS